MNILTHNNIYIRSTTKPDNTADIWLLHGSGESSLSFRDAFEHFKNTPYNLYAPDYPGYGASPPQSDCQNFKQLTNILQTLISEISTSNPIHLIGHSMGGMLASELCILEKSNPIKSITNIEGPLTEGDITFSRTALAAQENPEDGYQSIINYIHEHAANDPALMGYLASLKFAAPHTFHTFALEVCKHGSETDSGQKYKSLQVPKLYISGKNYVSDSRTKFIRDNTLDVITLDAGHWPMIDKPQECYNAIRTFIESHSA